MTDTTEAAPAATPLSEFKLVEYCQGSHKNRGTLMPARSIWAKGIKEGHSAPAFHSAVFMKTDVQGYMNEQLGRVMSVYRELKSAYDAKMAANLDNPEAIAELVEPKKPKASLAGFHDEHWAPYFMIDVDTRREGADLERIEEAGKPARWRQRTDDEKDAWLLEHETWEPEVDAPRYEALEVIRVLQGYGVDPERLLITFSGNKGFHIYVPTAYFLPEPCAGWIYRIRWMVENALVPVVDRNVIPYPEESIDWQVYTPLTVLRAINSVHQKSGLYKNPIGWDELQAQRFDEIHDKATAPRVPWPHPDWNGIEISTSLREFWEKSAEFVQDGRGVRHGNVEGRGFITEGRLDFDSEELHVDGHVPNRPLCVLKMLREDVGSGNRNPSMLLIASTLRDEGNTPEEAFLLMERWLEKQKGSHKTTEDIQTQINYVYQRGFNWGCNHSLAMANCYSKCLRYRGAQEKREIELHRLPDLLEELRERERLPITYYFPYEPFTTGIRLRPKQVVTFVAQTGIGKTAFMLDFCRVNSGFLDYYREQGAAGPGGIGFASLEMPREELAERAAQWAVQGNQEKVSGILKAQNASLDAGEGDTEAYQRLVGQLATSHGNVWVAEENYVDLKKLKTIIEVGKETANIGLWIVDYMGRMTGKGHNSYERLGAIAKGLKTVARETEVIILVLVQISRAESDKGVIGLRSARGSGEIEENSDIIVVAYRDKHGDDPKKKKDDEEEIPTEAAVSSPVGGNRQRGPVRIVMDNKKNRGGEPDLRSVVDFHGATMSFFHVPDPGEREYPDHF